MAVVGTSHEDAQRRGGCVSRWARQGERQDGQAGDAGEIGDRVEARLHDRERICEVATLVAKRVGAPVAETCFVDHSPPPPAKDDYVPLFERDRGTGRPTKRDRRQLDRLRGRSR
jgi:hypothetical protein